MAESINFPLIQKMEKIVNSRTLKHERAYFLTVSEEKPVIKLTNLSICQLFTLKLLVIYLK